MTEDIRDGIGAAADVEGLAARTRLARERTHLANERNTLAFVRTGLSSFVLGAALIRLWGEDADYMAAGLAAIFLGLAFIVSGIAFHIIRRRRIGRL